MQRKVFISYRVADTRSTAGRLASDLRRLFGVDGVFLDHVNTDPAEQWPERVQNELARSSALLVLIGKSWLTAHDEYGRRRIDSPDDWVRQEIAAGLRFPGKVLPLLVNDALPIPPAAIANLDDIAKLATTEAVPLRDVDWESDVARVVDWLETRGLERVASEVVDDTTTLVGLQWQGNPYRGLAAFGPGDSPVYFGRERETEELLHRVESERVVGVVGASGSGKSSLVAAGLVPQLNDDWVCIRFTPAEFGDNPFTALARKSAPYVSMSISALSERLRNSPADIEAVAVEVLAARPADAQLLLFADQFEELFTARVHETYRAPFVDLVAAVAGSRHARIVFTLRADYTEHCARYESLTTHLRAGTFLLGTPGVTALKAMIERPARAAGLEIEPALVDRILVDAGTEPGSLALVEFTLEQLYDARPDGKLTLAAYESLEGVRGAISAQGEKAVRGVSGIVDDRALGRVFRMLATVDEYGGAVRKRGMLETLGVNERSLVDRLVDARLLVTDTGADRESTVQVAHEAVLRHWARFRQWLDANHEFELWRQNLATYRRDGALLSRGLPLKTALEWLKKRPADLDAEEQAYILASRNAARRFYGRRAASIVSVLLVIAAGTFTVWTARLGLNTELGLRALALRAGLSGLANVPLPEMEDVPEGSFAIGSVTRGAPSIDVAGFAMGKTEVTFEQYDVFAEATGRPLTDHEGWGRTSRPVINVSWEDAQAYADWLTVMTGERYRLPTEVEWEYAAQGADQDQAWAGTSNESELASFAWYAVNSERKTHPVGEKRPNSLGLYDMSGNVWEWVQDCYADDDQYSVRVDAIAREEDDCSNRVIRGGSLIEGASRLVTMFRGKGSPAYASAFIGFRLARGE